MGSEKPHFLAQPVVKSIFMFRNGDPYYEARRVVINHKRVSTFDTLLRELTGGIQAPFGAVRNIYTPRGGHKVDCLEGLRSGEQYVAAGREKFKKLDYQQIGSRKKRMMQSLPTQNKPLPQNRVIVSARFLKPIKEPCAIFVVANGDTLNPAMRLLVHQRTLGQFDRILEMITEKMGLRVLGGVRSLYTYEGAQVTDGNQLESGQLYVAVGRERFKRLPYNDLLFTKPRGTRRVYGMKAYSLPPIYRFSKQNSNGKCMVNGSNSADGDSKASPAHHNGNKKEHLCSIVREISQARLVSLRKKRRGQTMTLTLSDSAHLESKADDGNAEDKAPPDHPAVEKTTDNDTQAEDEEKEEEEDKEEATADNTAEDTFSSKKIMEEQQETNGVDEAGDGMKENDEQPDEKDREATEGSKQDEEEEARVKEEVKSEEQGTGGGDSHKTQNSEMKENGTDTSSEPERDEREENTVEKKQDEESGEQKKSADDQVNGIEDPEGETQEENGGDPDEIRSGNETEEKISGGGDSSSSSSSSSSSCEDGTRTTKNGAAAESEEEERKVSGRASGEDDEVESETQLEAEEKSLAGDRGADEDEDKRDKRKGLGRNKQKKVELS